MSHMWQVTYVFRPPT